MHYKTSSFEGLIWTRFYISPLLFKSKTFPGHSGGIVPGKLPGLATPGKPPGVARIKPAGVMQYPGKPPGNCSHGSEPYNINANVYLNADADFIAYDTDSNTDADIVHYAYLGVPHSLRS